MPSSTASIAAKAAARHQPAMGSHPTARAAGGRQFLAQGGGQCIGLCRAEFRIERQAAVDQPRESLVDLPVVLLDGTRPFRLPLPQPAAISSTGRLQGIAPKGRPPVSSS